MKIKVHKLDIKHGRPLMASHCAIARAVNRATGQRDACVMVGSKIIKVGGVEADMPQEAVTFANVFDLGKPVEPFSFELDLPAKFSRTTETPVGQRPNEIR